MARAGPVVVPGVTVDSSTTSIPGRRLRPALLMPSFRAEKSGIRSSLFLKGVWMERVTASISAIFEKSDVQANFFATTTFFRSSI